MLRSIFCHSLRQRIISNRWRSDGSNRIHFVGYETATYATYGIHRHTERQPARKRSGYNKSFLTSNIIECVWKTRSHEFPFTSFTLKDIRTKILRELAMHLRSLFSPRRYRLTKRWTGDSSVSLVSSLFTIFGCVFLFSVVQFSCLRNRFRLVGMQSFGPHLPKKHKIDIRIAWPEREEKMFNFFMYARHDHFGHGTALFLSSAEFLAGLKNFILLRIYR